MNDSDNTATDALLRLIGGPGLYTQMRSRTSVYRRHTHCTDSSLLPPPYESRAPTKPAQKSPTCVGPHRPTCAPGAVTTYVRGLGLGKLTVTRGCLEHLRDRCGVRPENTPGAVILCNKDSPRPRGQVRTRSLGSPSYRIPPQCVRLTH